MLGATSRVTPGLSRAMFSRMNAESRYRPWPSPTLLDESLEADLPARRLHDLRHTAATFMLSGGGTLAATSQILGHSEKSTTLRIYGHVIDRDSVRAVRTIDVALRNGSTKSAQPKIA